MNTIKTVPIIAAALATVLTVGGCVSRGDVHNQAIPAPTASTTAPKSASRGAVSELSAVVGTAQGVGMVCGHVDDTPLFVWDCYKSFGQLNISLELISKDRSRLSMFTLVSDNSISSAASDQDAKPQLMEFAEKIVPAAYHGKESGDILNWASGNPGQDVDGKVFGPINASLSGDGSFYNLSVFFEQVDLPDRSEVFDEFHVKDALAWGEAAGLECSQGVDNPDVGGFEKVRCGAASGPRAAIDFMLAFDDDPATPDGFSDTDIQQIHGNFVDVEPGSKQALAELVANLIQRMSGNPEDATKARQWVLDVGGRKVDSELGTLHALLVVTPDNVVEGMYNEVMIQPVGYQPH